MESSAVEALLRTLSPRAQSSTLWITPWGGVRPRVHRAAEQPTSSSVGRADGRRIEVEPDQVRDPSEVYVTGKERCTMTPGDSGDHAVDQASGCDAAATTAAVDEGGGVEVACRVEPQKRKSSEQLT